MQPDSVIADSDDECSDSITDTILRRMRQPAVQKLCDIEIVVAGCSFSCHKAVLCAATDFFCHMLTGDWRESRSREIHLNGIDPRAFENVLEFIYNGRLRLRANDILQTHTAAKLLQLDTLDDLIRGRLISRLSPNNVFAIGAHAYSLDDHKVHHACKIFLLRNFDAVVNSHIFLALPYEVVVDFLFTNVHIISVDKALLAAMRWVQHQFTQRKNHFIDFWEYICPSRMTRDELMALCDTFGIDVSVMQKTVDCELRQSNYRINESDKTQNPDSSEEHMCLLYNEENCVNQLQQIMETRSQDVTCTSNDKECRGSAEPYFRISQKCVRNIQFDFVVPDVSRKEMSSPPICSPWYNCGGDLLWRLEVYLNGSSPSFRDYMSVYLRCMDESATSTFLCKAQFSFFVLEQDFGNREWVFEAEKMFSTSEPCWGKARYIKRSEILTGEKSLGDFEPDAVVFGVNITWETRDFTADSLVSLPC